MRYDETHKQETRKRVLKAAAAAVRSRGPDGVSVAEIMKEAGLTHGGFYAHFASKDALVAEAIDESFRQSRRHMPLYDETLGDEAALAGFVDRYVSAFHRDHPESGCVIAAMSSHIPRQAMPVREAFDRGVTGLVGAVAKRLTLIPEEARGELATSLVAEASGAVAMARAVADPDLSDRLLEQSRRRIKARAGLAAQSNDKDPT